MKPGITLIELLVVIALFGIIAGVGFPNLAGWNCKQEIRNDFASVNNIFEQARDEAINRSRTVLVRTIKNLPSDGATYRAFLLDNRNCNASQSSQSLELFIPNVVISNKTQLFGPSAQCFHSDGTATASQAAQQHQMSRTCRGIPITYQTFVFGATGLLDKQRRFKNAWVDF